MSDWAHFRSSIPRAYGLPAERNNPNQNFTDASWIPTELAEVDAISASVNCRKRDRRAGRVSKRPRPASRQQRSFDANELKPVEMAATPTTTTIGKAGN